MRRKCNPLQFNCDLHVQRNNLLQIRDFDIKNSNNNAVTKWSNNCWNDEWNYDELILNAVTIKNKNNNDVAKDSNNNAVTKITTITL